MEPIDQLQLALAALSRAAAQRRRSMATLGRAVDRLQGRLGEPGRGRPSRLGGAPRLRTDPWRDTEGYGVAPHDSTRPASATHAPWTSLWPT